MRTLLRRVAAMALITLAVAGLIAVWTAAGPVRATRADLLQRLPSPPTPVTPAAPATQAVPRVLPFTPRPVPTLSERLPPPIIAPPPLAIPTLTAPATPTLSPPTPSATATPVEPARVSLPMVEAEWPRDMSVDASDTVRISLVRVSETDFVPSVEIPGHTAVVATPIPVGTPGVPLEKTFGPDLHLTFRANLGSGAFDIHPVSTIEFQPLDRPRIRWSWNVTAKNGGSQILSASIDARWTAGQDGPVAVERNLWRERLPVEVHESWLALGQLQFLSVLSAVAGAWLGSPELLKLARTLLRGGRRGRQR